ncbi:type II toxin-antitoxin system HigB family toxin [Bradyrhizobium sediminis]|uniref:Type II toxin-antitoxin system HigB family toxin n=1 Tax=Bradyrhizobium sediminis TaxID=2840469 RepID=A0A975NDN3_9BRAD|nr:type II toxin-antitoxin system HigB family toxin [Bradyrhizobium sediminis]
MDSECGWIGDHLSLWFYAHGLSGGDSVDFVGDNRVIFDLGGNKYRLVVHVASSFGRLLVKFIGTHAEYDRIDPEIVSWRKR